MESEDVEDDEEKEEKRGEIFLVGCRYSSWEGTEQNSTCYRHPSPKGERTINRTAVASALGYRVS